MSYERYSFFHHLSNTLSIPVVCKHMEYITSPSSTLLKANTILQLSLPHSGSISGTGPTGTTFAFTALEYPSLYYPPVSQSLPKHSRSVMYRKVTTTFGTAALTSKLRPFWYTSFSPSSLRALKTDWLYCPLLTTSLAQHNPTAR